MNLAAISRAAIPLLLLARRPYEARNNGSFVEPNGPASINFINRCCGNVVPDKCRVCGGNHFLHNCDKYNLSVVIYEQQRKSKRETTPKPNSYFAMHDMEELDDTLKY